MRVKDISISLRPREKMLQGLYLDDAELLALILEKGSKNVKAAKVETLEQENSLLSTRLAALED